MVRFTREAIRTGKMVDVGQSISDVSSSSDEAPPQPFIVSICIPTYNRVDMLKRAVMSAQAQTESRIEIFVSDNASTDGTEYVVRRIAEMDPRIRYAKNHQNLGMVGNWNRCLEEARAPLMVLLNDDDVLSQGAIKKAMGLFHQYPKAVIVFGSTRNCRYDGKVIFLNRPFSTEFLLSPFETHRAVWLRNCFQLTLSVFRTDAARSIGGFSEEVGWCTDTDFILRLTARWPSVVTPFDIGTYFIHPGQLTGWDNLAVSQWQHLMVERIFEEVKSMPDLSSLRPIAEGEFLSRYAIHYAASALRRAHRAEAIDFLRQARTLGIPKKKKHWALYFILRAATSLPGGTVAFMKIIAPVIKALAAKMSRMD